MAFLYLFSKQLAVTQDVDRQYAGTVDRRLYSIVDLDRRYARLERGLWASFAMASCVTITLHAISIVPGPTKDVSHRGSEQKFTRIS